MSEKYGCFFEKFEKTKFFEALLNPKVVKG